MVMVNREVAVGAKRPPLLDSSDGLVRLCWAKKKVCEGGNNPSLPRSEIGIVSR